MTDEPTGHSEDGPEPTPVDAQRSESTPVDAPRPEPLFSPPVALASLSGQSDAEWARAAAPFVGAAFLGGVALDDATREAARAMVDRDREEFLPPDPVAFVDDQLAALDDVPLRPAVNVRSVAREPITRVAKRCRARDAVLEVNAHCRQDEMCAAGAGERLMCEPDRLAGHVAAAADAGATVSVKLRAEVDGVALPAVARRCVDAGATILHVDAMDSPDAVARVSRAVADDDVGRSTAPPARVVANNGVRDAATVAQYRERGAAAVSVGRPSDDPAVLERVRRATADWREVAAP